MTTTRDQAAYHAQAAYRTYVVALAAYVSAVHTHVLISNHMRDHGPAEFTVSDLDEAWHDREQAERDHRDKHTAMVAAERAVNRAHFDVLSDHS